MREFISDAKNNGGLIAWSTLPNFFFSIQSLCDSIETFVLPEQRK